MYKVPQQQYSIGLSQQIVSKQETESKLDVVKPNDSGEGKSQASNSKEDSKNCSVQQSESQTVSPHSVILFCLSMTDYFSLGGSQ